MQTISTNDLQKHVLTLLRENKSKELNELHDYCLEHLEISESEWYFHHKMAEAVFLEQKNK